MLPYRLLGLALPLSLVPLGGCADDVGGRPGGPDARDVALPPPIIDPDFTTVDLGDLAIQISRKIRTDDVGAFHHYLPESVYAQRELGYVVLRPADPAERNGAGYLSVLSGGFRSWDLDAALQSEALLAAHAPFVEAGYTVFLVNHGDGNPHMPADTEDPTSRYLRPAEPGGVPQPHVGWLAPEIFEQAARAVRHIKFYADAYDVDPDRLAATGGSSGGAIALSMLLAEDAVEDSPLYTFVDGIDDEDSRVAAATVNNPGADVVNYRDYGDEAYLHKWPHLFMQPDLTGLGFPAPPPAQCGCMQEAFFADRIGTPREQHYPERNAKKDIQAQPWPWHHDPYPPLCCPELREELDEKAFVNRVDASTGPTLWFHGTWDHQVPVFPGDPVPGSGAAGRRTAGDVHPRQEGSRVGRRRRGDERAEADRLPRRAPARGS